MGSRRLNHIDLGSAPLAAHEDPLPRGCGQEPRRLASARGTTPDLPPRQEENQRELWPFRKGWYLDPRDGRTVLLHPRPAVPEHVGSLPLLILFYYRSFVGDNSVRHDSWRPSFPAAGHMSHQCNPRLGLSPWSRCRVRNCP